MDPILSISTTTTPVVSVLSDNVNIKVYMQSARPFPSPAYVGGGFSSFCTGFVQAPLSCPPST